MQKVDRVQCLLLHSCKISATQSLSPRLCLLSFPLRYAAFLELTAVVAFFQVTSLLEDDDRRSRTCRAGCPLTHNPAI